MIYLHVPFCRSFCIYCDFYSEIACRERDAPLFASFTDAVCGEISRRQDEIEATRSLNTLYIGGGTPSVLPLICLQQIVHQITGGVPLGPPGPSVRETPSAVFPFAEFTVEVNPEDIVEKGGSYVRGLIALGVNRISMGVQSLDDGILRWMNRRHDVDHARQAFRILRDAGVSNLSVDLIFGLPQLSDAVLRQTLSELAAWQPEHISAYQLSLETGSILGRMAREGGFSEASQEQCASQYALICRMLQDAGYRHYEISNWALPGFEAVHNSAYWSRNPYVGLGPGAHSFDGRVRYWNENSLRPYLHGPLSKQTKKSGGQELLSEAEIREEEIMLGLRTARGIPEELADPDRVASLLTEGALERIGDHLRIPEDHWFVSDDIIARLF